MIRTLIFLPLDKKELSAAEFWMGSLMAPKGRPYIKGRSFSFNNDIKTPYLTINSLNFHYCLQHFVLRGKDYLGNIT